MITTILILTLFNFLMITLGIVIYAYQFFVKYIKHNLEAKKIKNEKLIEEYNKEKNIKENKIEGPALKITPIELDPKEGPKDNVQV